MVVRGEGKEMLYKALNTQSYKAWAERVLEKDADFWLPYAFNRYNDCMDSHRQTEATLVKNIAKTNKLICSLPSADLKKAMIPSLSKLEERLLEVQYKQRIGDYVLEFACKNSIQAYEEMMSKALSLENLINSFDVRHSDKKVRVSENYLIHFESEANPIMMIKTLKQSRTNKSVALLRNEYESVEAVNFTDLNGLVSYLGKKKEDVFLNIENSRKFFPMPYR